MRRLISIALLCGGAANLVWLNNSVYPRYQEWKALEDNAALGGVLAKPAVGKVEPSWINGQLDRQPAFLVLPFDAHKDPQFAVAGAGLSKLSVAQVQNFAVQLAKRGDNYWVQVRGFGDAQLDAGALNERRHLRAQKTRELLLQSGLAASRVLLAREGGEPPQVVAGQDPASPALGKARRVEIRVLEVQTQ